MQVPVCIINLASAKHRRAFQETQAASLGFEPVWIQAVSINEISDAFFYTHAFDWERPLKKTEIACFMSHLSIWRTIATGDTPVVVLEDDAVLGGPWVENIQLLAQHAQVDCICLEAWGKKILGSSKRIANLTLRRLHLNSAGAAAYMLWPSGARHLLARYELHGMALADAFINQTKAWQVWQLVPANAIQMSVAPIYGLPVQPGGESLISRETHASATPLKVGTIIRMKWRRLKSEVAKGCLQIYGCLIAGRDYVPYLHYQNTKSCKQKNA